MNSVNIVKIDGKGVHNRCSLENGKAHLEWQVDWDETAYICLKDAQGNVVLECYKMPGEEEPLQSVLLKPCLWNGVANPYLYHLEVILRDRYGNSVDRFAEQFPLRSITKQVFSGTGEEYLLLNGEKFSPKMVRYHVPAQKASGERQRQLLEDMRQFVDLGINSIYLKKEEVTTSFLQLCDRFGLLAVMVDDEKLWVSGQALEEGEGPVKIGDVRNIPVFRGMENALLGPDNRPTRLFYKFKASWSKVPFVYILSDSLLRQKSGNYEVTCYSNCGKVALYSDGKLFEFQQGQEIFTFQEVPAKGPCIVLAAEGEGCSTSLSVHKTFTKLSPIGDN